MQIDICDLEKRAPAEAHCEIRSRMLCRSVRVLHQQVFVQKWLCYFSLNNDLHLLSMGSIKKDIVLLEKKMKKKKNHTSYNGLDPTEE